ncbi:hypothetical protein CspeluHIS016_0206230 [Cutaneotrichosporon spelunceum]|uniref:Uncharacterized protein n=1 Tax=Cutaneotrichosporon spelunceum TaxID=1672016 RepID=A0AAD3YB61_9TREE|nr:hypothetical protein CspeluHIS016_0206230 [Cutaneotrichosporon spelunceum]
MPVASSTVGGSSTPRQRARRRSTDSIRPLGFMSEKGYISDREEGPEDKEKKPVAQTQVRKEEPMKPITVVLYVVFVYVVWQILTRADDTDFLDSPKSSPRFTAQPTYERNSSPAPQYQLPYAIPTPLAPAEASSTWRWVLACLVYPLYILITLIAIPFPFLLNGLNLLVTIIAAILHPFTSTLRLLTRTFVIGPLTVVKNFLSLLYPVYVFVAAVVAAGAFLGVTFGWAGRILSNLILRPPSRRRKTGRSKSKRHSPSTSNEDRSPQTHRQSLPLQRSSSASQQRPRPVSASYERRFVPIVDVIEIVDDEFLPYEPSHTTARKGVVLGVRRRGGRV